MPDELVRLAFFPSEVDARSVGVNLNRSNCRGNRSGQTKRAFRRECFFSSSTASVADGSVHVRPGRERDLPGIVAIYNHYVRRSPASFEVLAVGVEDRRDWFEAHAQGGRHQLWVAADDRGRILGWATTSPFRPRAAYATTVESSVYCRTDSLHRGLGTALYSALFHAIRDEDIERIVAAVTLPNPASIGLHRSFGFRPVGVFTRVGRKLGRYWDVAWFERPRVLPSVRNTSTEGVRSPAPSRSGPPGRHRDIDGDAAPDAERETERELLDDRLPDSFLREEPEPTRARGRGRREAPARPRTLGR